MSDQIDIDIRDCTTNADSYNFAYVGGLIQSQSPAAANLAFKFAGQSGVWAIRIKYACAEVRPVNIKLKSRASTLILTPIALNQLTGGWGSNDCQTVTVGNAALQDGDQVLEVFRTYHIPHLSHISLHRCLTA